MYGTVAKADTYFLTERFDLNQLWAGETDQNKTAAMNMATRAIDNLNFTGDKNDAGQSLEFPRGTDTTVPLDIEYACYECAYSFLDGFDPEREGELEASIAVSVGPTRERKAADFVPIHQKHGIPSVTAWRLLIPYLRNGREVTLSRVD